MTHIWQRVHFGTWSVGDQILTIGVNLDDHVQTVPLSQLPRWQESAKVDMLYTVGTTVESGHLIFQGLGATGFVISTY